jgi:hypothetical protein
MNPVPSVLAILLCDHIIIEQGTGKTSLIGIFDDLNVPQVPVAQGLGFFARLTDAEGHYQFTIREVYLGEQEKVLGRVDVNPIDAVDRLGMIHLSLNLPPLPFPDFGRYEFQLFADEIYLGRATLQVKQIKERHAGS